MGNVALRVKGNMDSLQSDINFYLRLVSASDIKSLSDYKKGVLYEFKKEDELKYTTYLSENSNLDKGKSIENSDIEELEETKEICTQDDSRLEDTKDYFDVSDESIEETKEESENQKDLSYVEGLFEVENEDNSMYSEHGVYIEDILNEPTEEDTDEYIEDRGYVEEKEYSEHGTYIEDLDDISFDIGKKEDLEEYASHGVYIEDILNEPIDEEQEEDDVEDDYNEEDYIPDEDDWDNSTEDEYVETESDSEEYNWDNNNEDENDYEEEVECDLEEYDEVIEEVTEEVTGKSNEKSSESEVQDLSISNVIEDVPSDIRVFLKKYPNSEISFVLKYYSSKEVDKQLKLGRIFKRKGKLSI